MAKKEFKFDEDSDDFGLGDESLPAEDVAPVATPAKKKGLSLKLPSFQMPSRKTLLLLVLLVVIAAGGAAFLVLTTPEPPPPPPPPAKKKVVVKPEAAPPAAQPAAVPAQPAASPQAKPAAPPAPAPAPAVAVTAPAKVEPKAAPTAPAVAVKVDAKAAAAPVPAPAKAAAAPVPAPAKAAAPRENVAAVAADLPFVVKGGLYSDRAALAAARRKVGRLGFETYVKTVRTPMQMTRLRIGYFPEDEAIAKAAELSKQYQGIFTLRDGGRLALYAGSYADLDKAREFADELYKSGISVTEEPVEVVVPRKQLYVGGFASREEAAEAAKRLRSSGFAAEVGKR